VTELEKLLAHPEYKSNQIYHFTSTSPEKAANAAFLICAFQVHATSIIRSLLWGTLQSGPSSRSSISRFGPFGTRGTRSAVTSAR